MAVDNILYLVDILENWIAFATYNYNISEKYNNDNPNYFDELFQNKLYEDYKLESLELLRSMPESDRDIFLKESMLQFTTHSPGKRVDAIYNKYWEIFNPDEPEWIMAVSHKLLVNPALKAYNKHFPKYKEFVTSLFNDNISGTLNLLEHIFGNEVNLTDSVPLKDEIEQIEKPHEEVDEIKQTEKPVEPAEIITPEQAKEISFLNNTFSKVLDIFKPRSYPDELFEYYDAWVDMSVTLNQWLSFPKEDIIYIIQLMEISDDERESLIAHHYSLYQQCVNNLTSSYIDKFENLQFQNSKIEIAQRDSALINDLINGNLDAIKIERLNTIFSNHDWKKMVLQFEMIIRSRFHSDSNHDIHHEDSFLSAEAIYRYRNYLIQFLNNTNNPAPEKLASTEFKQSTVAFKYKKLSSNISQLTELFNTLKKHHYISGETDIKDFRKIFSQALPDKPITWIGTLEEITYFVKLLHLDYQVIDKMTKDIWKVTANLFVDEHGSPYDRNKFRGQKTPARASQLEKAVAKLV